MVDTSAAGAQPVALYSLNVTVPAPSAFTSPLSVAVSWIVWPTVALATAFVTIAGCALLTCEVSPVSPQTVAAGLLFESPA